MERWFSMHGHRLTTGKLVFKIGKNFKITIWIETFILIIYLVKFV